MQTRIPLARLRLLAAATTTATLAALTPLGHGQSTALWINGTDSTANWNDPANWFDGIHGFGQAGALVSFNNTDLSGPLTVVLDGTYTVGTLTVGDNAGTRHPYTFSGGTLVFNSSGPASAAYNQGTNTGPAFIQSAIQLVHDLTLTIQSNATLTLSGSITGARALTKAQLGTLILTGATNESTNVTLTRGTLQLGDGGTTGTLGSGTVTMSNSSILRFNRSDDFTVGNTLAGVGIVEQAGPGTVSLTGANTFSAGVRLTAGALEVGSTGALGNFGTITFNGGTLRYSAANTTDYSGRFSSAANQLYRVDTNGQSVTLASALTSSGGALTKLGTGTLTLTGDNTYTGTTTVSAGTLQIGNGGTVGTLGSGSVTNNAALVFHRSDDFTVANAISGTGSVTKLGASTLTLTGENTYSGITTVAAGTLRTGATGAFSSNSVHNIASDATLDLSGIDSSLGGLSGSGTVSLGSAALSVNQDTSTTFSGTLSGAGTFTKVGAGTLTFSGNNTHSGGTTLSAGTLALGSAGALGTSGQISFNGGTLQFSAANTTDYSARFSAAANQLYRVDTNGQNITLASALTSSGGALTKLGTGTLSLTGANTYSGGTTLSAGTLALGSAHAIGSSGTISFSGGTLQFSAANTTDYSSRFSTAANQLYHFDTNGQNVTLASTLISFGGSLSKLGSGTLTLTGANNYSDGTTIEGGTLQVSGFQSLGTGAVVNHANLVFAPPGSQAYPNLISGSGSVGIATGSVNLTGNSTYTGGTTVSAGASLRIGDGGTSGTIGPGQIINDGFVQFDRSDAFTLTNAVSGSGVLWQLGSGSLILTGNNSYTGFTTITAGSLQVGNGGTAGVLGSGAVNLGFGGNLTFNRSDAVTAANTLFGLGSLTQLGSGTLTLTGTNTYSGGTTLSAGTLALGSANALGTSGQISFNGGTLQFSAANTTDYSARFSTAANQLYRFDTNGQNVTLASTLNSFGGSLSKLGSGILTLTGANNYSGGTTIEGGTLQVSGFQSLGTSAVVNHANLVFAPPSFQAYPNLISGSGSVAISAGSVNLTGNSTYTGSTTVSAGASLRIGSGGTSGTIGPGQIINDGAVQFERSDAFTLTNSISGSGVLWQLGTGSLILTGNNSYSGGTTLSAGSLQIGNGGTAGVLGSGAVNLGFGGNLTFNRSDAVTAANTLSGFGSLTQLGSGTLTLTGDNSYSGGTTLSAGTLALGSANALGTTGTISFNGGTLQSSAANTTDYSARFSTAANQLYRFDTNGQDVTLASALTSSGGSLTKLGSGTLILTGTNTYSGGTTLSAGTLQVGDGGTSGSLGSGDVSIAYFNTSLVFNRSDDLSLSNNLLADFSSGYTPSSVESQIVKLGSGTLTLSGRVEPAVTVSSGTLQLSSRLGVRDFFTHIQNNSAVSFDSPGTMTYHGIIRGNGSLTKLGQGDLTVTSSQGHTGTTTISAGTLTLFDISSFGTGEVVNHGSLRLIAEYNSRLENRVSGSGSLLKVGPGASVLVGDNTYSGSTTILQGTLQIGDSRSFGSLGSGEVINHANLAFNRSDSFTVANQISGSGSLTKLGAGSLTLSGDNSYEGGTTVSAGTLQVGDGGTAGSLGSGDIANHASLIFNRSDAISVAAAISGSGSLTKLGTGTLILAGGNSYSGITSVSTGTLQIGDGGTAGSLGSGNVVTSGTLLFNRSDATTAPNAISGTGHLAQAGSGTLSLTGANSYSGSTTISAGTLQIGDGGTTGSLGSGDVTNNATLAFNRSNQLTVTNVISGSGSLTQRGSGVTTFTGNNSYSGITTILSGTLRIGASGTSGSLGSGTVLNHAALDYNRSDTVTVANAIAGSGSLAQIGSGTLTLTGHNTYTGITTVSTGTLQIGDGGTSGSLGTGNITNHSHLAFSRSDALTVANNISGSGSLTKLSAGTLTLSGTNTYSGGTHLAAGTLALGSSGALGTSGPITFSGGILQSSAANTTDYSARFSTAANQAYRIDTNDQNLSLASPLTSVGGSLTKLGSGTLHLSGTNTYSGGTTLSAGTLQIGSSGALGTSGTITFNGGTLQYSSANTTDYSARFSASPDQAYRLDTNGQTITLASALTSPGGSLTKLGSGTLIISAANTYSSDTTVSAGSVQIGNGGTAGSLGSGAVTVASGATLAFNRSDALNLANNISGAGSLIKTGSGTLTLTGDNTYSGGTTLSAGTLALGSANAIGTTGTISFNGGTLQSSAANTTDYSARFSTAANQLYRFDTNGQDVTLASALTSSGGSLTKLGSGTLILTGTNTYSGGTTLSAGTLQVGDGGTSGSLGSGDVSIAYFNTSLVFNRSDDLSLSNNLLADFSSGYTPSSVESQIVKLGSGTLTLTGIVEPGVTVSDGTLQLSSRLGVRDFFTHIQNNSAVSFDSPGTMTYHGIIRGNGSLTKLGQGDLTVTSSQGHTGTTTISAGTLTLFDISSFGTGEVVNHGSLRLIAEYNSRLENRVSGSGSLLKVGPGASVLVGDNTYSGSTTILQGTLQIGDSRSFGSLGSGEVINHANLAFNRSDSFTVANQISGFGSLTKLGSGSLTLTGDNTYEGGTTVSAGTLQIGNATGSALGSGNVTVTAGATLTGPGSFTGSLTVAGTLAPGNSPGTLSAGHTTFSSGGTYLWEINDATGAAGSAYDQLAITGSLSITATSANPFTVRLVSLLPDNSPGLLANFDPARNHSYSIASTTAGITGFDSSAFLIDRSAFANFLSGGAWSLALANSGRDLVLNFTSAIPEPSSAAALLGLVALGGAASRRRRQP